MDMSSLRGWNRLLARHATQLMRQWRRHDRHTLHVELTVSRLLIAGCIVVVVSVWVTSS